jgi:hypothetical protein
MNFASAIRMSAATRTVEMRVSQYDWSTLSEEINSYGCAVIEKLLSPEECRQIAGLYPEEGPFRSQIHMARHGFGEGEYRYFKYPLPDLIESLRTALYPHLANIANGWNERMGIDQRYPERHAEFLKHVTSKVRRGQRRCCCNTWRATSTACIRIFTATSHSRCRLQSCSLNPKAISQAASLS